METAFLLGPMNTLRQLADSQACDRAPRTERRTAVHRLGYTAVASEQGRPGACNLKKSHGERKKRRASPRIPSPFRMTPRPSTPESHGRANIACMESERVWQCCRGYTNISNGREDVVRQERYVRARCVRCRCAMRLYLGLQRKGI